MRFSFKIPPDENPKREPGKLEETVDVAFPESSRFLDDAVDPLHAAFLHPAGSPLHFPRDEIEGTTHADHDGYVQLFRMASHPEFLLGVAQRDKEQIRFRRIDALDDFRLLLVQPHDSRVNADDVDPDLSRLGLKGSPTKVKKIDNIVLSHKESQQVAATPEALSQLMTTRSKEHIIS